MAVDKAGTAEAASRERAAACSCGEDAADIVDAAAGSCVDSSAAVAVVVVVVAAAAAADAVAENFVRTHAVDSGALSRSGVRRWAGTAAVRESADSAAYRADAAAVQAIFACVDSHSFACAGDVVGVPYYC